MSISKQGMANCRSHDELWDAIEAKPRRETFISLIVGETEAQALVAGTVTDSVRRQAQMAIDSEWETAKAITRKAG